MAAITTMEHPLSPTGVEATRFAMAKTAFQASIISKFVGRFDAWEMLEKVTFTGRKTDRSEVFGELEARNHTPGEFLGGQKMDKTPRLLELEDHITEASVREGYVEDFVNHLNSNPEYSQKAADALRARCNKETLQQLVLAARTAPVTVGATTFDGGNRDVVNVGGATELADVFPISSAGATVFLNALGRLNMSYMNKKVPDTLDKFCFIDPHLHEVLQQDSSILSRDYDGYIHNSKIKGKVMFAKGYHILPTPASYMPTDDLSGAPTAGDPLVPLIRGTPVYRGDFTKVAAVIMVPGALKAAVGHSIMPIAINSEETLSSVIGARMFKGIGINRPELAGVIEWSGT